MVNKAVAYLGSQVACKSCNSPVAVTTFGSNNVFINGKSALRVGDTFAPYVCPVCLTSSLGGTVIQGSSNVFINGMQLATVGSKCSDGSTVISGNSNVFVGDGVNIGANFEQNVAHQTRGEIIKHMEDFKVQKAKLPSAIITEENKSTNTTRAFVARDYPAGSSLDPFRADKFEAELAKRLNQVDYVKHLDKDKFSSDRHYKDYKSYLTIDHNKYPNQKKNQFMRASSIFLLFTYRSKRPLCKSCSRVMGNRRD